MLFNLPIEPLEERYSKQWNEWVPEDLHNANCKFVTILPDAIRATIRHGQFLDVVGTHIFKSRQLESLLSLIEFGDVKGGDVIFFHDAWFPGMEALFYIRDALKRDFKITGLLHAGTYDPHDFLTQSGMSRWASKLESCWFQEMDAVFVATEFHKELLVTSKRATASNIHVTGFPIRDTDLSVSAILEKKENIVVFPHRLAPEKNPYLFDEIAERAVEAGLKDWKFIKTKDVCNTKAGYYALLEKAKVAVSCADQETWGIAQQEAALRYCLPVVPDRLSYKEMYPAYCRYKSLQEAAGMVCEFGLNYEVYTGQVELSDRLDKTDRQRFLWLNNTLGNLKMNGKNSISRMVRIMRAKGWNV